MTHIETQDNLNLLVRIFSKCPTIFSNFFPLKKRINEGCTNFHNGPYILKSNKDQQYLFSLKCSIRNEQFKRRTDKRLYWQDITSRD